MEEERFNEMTDDEIVGILKAISDRYGVRYYKVGYSSDFAGDMMVCIDGNAQNYKNITRIIHGVLLRMTDLDGNTLEVTPDYDDDYRPSVRVCDTVHMSLFNIWVEFRERSGEIIKWLKVE